MKLAGITLMIAILSALLAACGSGGGSASTPTSKPDSAGNSGTAGEAIACAAAQGETEEFGATKLIFEYNSTDNDTGFHGQFDASGWSELCLYGPDGEQVLAVKPQKQLKDLTMGTIFFESREPPDAEMSQEEILASFPEGSYKVAGKSFDGKSLTGTATLTHDIPNPAVISFPAEGDVVDPSDLVVTWDPVTQTTTGDPVEITGYEVIVTNEKAEDPQGFSQPVLSAHVLPSVTSLTVPSEFMEPGTEYELEVLALEKSGNQTISVLFFETR